MLCCLKWVLPSAGVCVTLGGVQADASATFKWAMANELSVLELVQVVVYYRAMSKPIAKRHFGAAAGGAPAEAGQFISAVCWKPRSRMLLAATSLGVVKVMQLTS